jgi:cyclin C
MYPPYIIALAALYISFTINASSAAALAPSTSSNNTSSVRLRSADPTSKPSTAAEFLASFEVSLPVLLACVQDIITIYPLWNEMENNLASAEDAGGGRGVGESEAEALVRRMIEAHLLDLNHPDSAASAKTMLASAVNANAKKRMR